MPSPTRLRLQGRSLVLVAGMPGAGKSTLLSRLRRGPDLRVLDSDAPRGALARLLPGLPYPAYRPLVHAVHRLGVVAAACSGAAVVAVHLPATGAGTRAAVARLAALTGRSAHLVWVHAAPHDARRGQHARGRLVPRRSFAAHAARAEAATALLRVGPVPGFASVTLLDRAAAAAGLVLDGVGGGPRVAARSGSGAAGPAGTGGGPAASARGAGGAGCGAPGGTGPAGPGRSGLGATVGVGRSR